MASVLCTKSFTLVVKPIPPLPPIDWNALSWTVYSTTADDGEGGDAHSTGGFSGATGNWDTLSVCPNSGQHAHNYLADVASQGVILGYTGPAVNCILHVNWNLTGSHNAGRGPGSNSFTIEVKHGGTQIAYHTISNENDFSTIDIPFIVPISSGDTIVVNYGQTSACGWTPEVFPGFWIDNDASYQAIISFTLSNAP